MNIDEFIQQPGQKELLLKGSILESLRVALPGEIISYDSSTRMASIQLVIREWGSSEDPPVLVDVPVFSIGGIVFPVNKGDECLVVFADSCIDSWIMNSGVSSPLSARRHDISDGFAFVGFSSRKRITEGYDLFGKLAELEERIEALEGEHESQTSE